MNNFLNVVSMLNDLEELVKAGKVEKLYNQLAQTNTYTIWALDKKSYVEVILKADNPCNKIDLKYKLTTTEDTTVVDFKAAYNYINALN